MRLGGHSILSFLGCPPLALNFHLFDLIKNYRVNLALLLLGKTEFIFHRHVLGVQRLLDFALNILLNFFPINLPFVNLLLHALKHCVSLLEFLLLIF